MSLVVEYDLRSDSSASSEVPYELNDVRSDEGCDPPEARKSNDRGEDWNASDKPDDCGNEGGFGRARPCSSDASCEW